MKLKLIQWVFFIIAVIPILSGCKREVPNANRNASFAKSYVIEGNQHILGSCQAPDGGYLLYGYTDWNTFGELDGFLMRIDEDYNMLWYKILGGFRNDEIKSANFDKNGNIFAGGSTISFDSINIQGNFPKMYAVYLTGNGEIIWEKSYTAPSKTKNKSTYANKVLCLPDGKFVLVGTTDNYQAIIPVDPNGGYKDVTRPFLLCLDHNGDSLWNTSYDIFEDTIGGFVYQNLQGANAVISKDGNVLLLAVKENSYFTGIGNPDLSVTLIKIDPNKSNNFNECIWKRKIPNLSIALAKFTISKRSIFVPFRLMNGPDEKYFIGEPNITPGFGIIDAEAKLLTTGKSAGIISENTSDLDAQNNSIFQISGNVLFKKDLSGNTIWSKDLTGSSALNVAAGIYIQNDHSLTIFCSYLNAKSDLDFATIRLDENGDFIN